MPVEVPVDGRVIVTALLFTEDLHRQDLDVGQLRFRAALPQSAAERHPPLGVIDQQVEQDERFFQAASRRPQLRVSLIRAEKTREWGIIWSSIMSPFSAISRP